VQRLARRWRNRQIRCVDAVVAGTLHRIKRAITAALDEPYSGSCQDISSPFYACGTRQLYAGLRALSSIASRLPVPPERACSMDHAGGTCLWCILFFATALLQLVLTAE